MSVTEARLAAIEARLAAVEARLASTPATTSSIKGGAVASDADLDSEYGDEVIKKDPKKWLEQGGESYVGCKMSECPSEYLRMLASLFDWMADKDEEQGKTFTDRNGKERPVAPINRKKAARARGWALRNEGRARSYAGNTHDGGATGGTADMDIPF